jgi:hypothetical protein
MARNGIVNDLMTESGEPPPSDPEAPVYDQFVGGLITLESKRALEAMAAEMKDAGRRGRQGAIVDVLIKLAAVDSGLKERVAAELPPGGRRRR